MIKIYSSVRRNNLLTFTLVKLKPAMRLHRSNTQTEICISDE